MQKHLVFVNNLLKFQDQMKAKSVNDLGYSFQYILFLMHVDYGIYIYTCIS